MGGIYALINIKFLKRQKVSRAKIWCERWVCKRSDPFCAMMSSQCPPYAKNHCHVNIKSKDLYNFLRTFC